MLAPAADLKALESFVKECRHLPSEEERQLAMSEFFFGRLHLLLPSGFDELRYSWVVLGERVGSAEEQVPHHVSACTPVRRALAGNVRDLATGAWYYVVYGAEPAFVRQRLPKNQNTDMKVAFFPVTGAKRLSEMRFIRLEDIARNCRASDSSPAAIFLPPLWALPDKHPRLEAVETTKVIIGALQRELIAFEDLKWQQVEDVIAELFRGQGREVRVTPRSSDGGRDIIVRTELLPGEPAWLAIEVKHKKVVKLPEVRSAISANRDFPALFVVTTGRFSAGVTREKGRPDMFLRLRLADRKRLKQWLATYPRQSPGA